MSGQRHVLVCYDSADDYRRHRLSRALLDCGTRIQESVFECLAEPALIEQMLERVRRLVVDCPDDRVCVVDLCANCERKVEVIGASPRASVPKSIVV